jgi:hypothetical protein
MKTYIGAIDFYFEAEDDAQAVRKLKQIAVKRARKRDDGCSALWLHEKPAGIAKARQISLN